MNISTWEREALAATAASTRRRAAVGRRRVVRLQWRLVLLPLFGVGLWLLGSQIFKSEGLPSPALVLLGMILVIPFLLTFYSDNGES